MFKRALSFIGSLQMAVVLLVAIGATLAYGTFFEATHNTPAVQRHVYQALWFHALLGFLILNLAASTLLRWPWRQRHVGFIFTHMGIILMLLGGLMSIYLGVEGQLVIPEGRASDTLEQASSLLAIHVLNPGEQMVFPVDFASYAATRQAHTVFTMQSHGAPVTFTVDRYYPDAVAEEQVTDDGDAPHPAIEVILRLAGQEERAWLFARDPERFGLQWGAMHVLFLEPPDAAGLARLLSLATEAPDQTAGTLRLEFPENDVTLELDVAQELGRVIPVRGTPYTVIVKQYFPDLIVSEHGVVNRSSEPHNPAVAFTITGPDGIEAFLRFARHPAFDVVHGQAHQAPVRATYAFVRGSPQLPPHVLAIVRAPDGSLLFFATGASADERHVEPLRVGQPYASPWMPASIEVQQYVPQARRTTSFRNVSDQPKQEAIHGVLALGGERADAWIPRGGAARLQLAGTEAIVAYRSDTRALPFEVFLHDFRKVEYPGTTLPQTFESDIDIRDPAHGVTLTRTVAMNQPVTYRGFKLFQASYAEEPQVMTILAVRKDPGTPVVYTGFLVIVMGLIAMFYIWPRGTTE